MKPRARALIVHNFIFCGSVIEDIHIGEQRVSVMAEPAPQGDKIASPESLSRIVKGQWCAPFDSSAVLLGGTASTEMRW